MAGGGLIFVFVDVAFSIFTENAIKSINIKTNNFSISKMPTKPWAILLIVLTTFLTSSAQILYKLGIPTLTYSIMGILTNYYLISGLFLYGIGATLMIISFRGGEVSVLYPIIATSYIWVSLLSIYFLGEKMNAFRWIGVFIIIAGIVSISYGSRQEVPVAGV